ncbi:oligopeptidase A [Kordia sp. SMS9]|uniref:M3 family metallopeptidase n=1 Tax=Kordia sp. SMS9 TaxID=2282170 RepID=UPI000E0CC2C8|nr:M3 family metallopeptidase [Kordia sp. SMS9]AXG67947.1 oligopeptidase A [Kordia sp. SMS9]
MTVLTHKFLTKHTTAPFFQIDESEFVTAIDSEIANAKKQIEQIVANEQPPTFENTIEALEYSDEQLDRITSIFFNLNSAETNENIQKMAQEISPKLTEFSNDIVLNEGLFERVKTLHAQKDTLNLTTEQHTLLDKKFKSFSRNGANLSKDKKEILREIDKKLSKLSLTFGENVLAETNKFQLHLTDEKDITGLPNGALEAAKSIAKSQDKDGWIFTLNYPSYIPFMKYADNRELRKQMATAFGSKAFKGDELDNKANVLEIAKLRHQRANLLGYETHAHFVLEERMAKTPEKVISFLNELLEKAKPAAEREFSQLSNFAKKLDGISALQSWDSAYYSEKLKQELFNLDDEKLKPYFKLENVIDGAFTVAAKLFDIHFQQVFDIEVYHKDVKTYEVVDGNGKFVAVFYADFHPRKGKRNGAWMTSYKSQYRKNGTVERPHVSIVCNFTKPTESKPSLLTFNEVTTLFHEFGHALHGMLADTTYPSLSGTSVFWDFVELPSQILENWCYEAEALAIFAKHYETGEVIPMEYIEKIKASATFLEGMATLRQISFGLLDMNWHGIDPTDITDVKAHEKTAFENTRLFPENPKTAMSTAFSHIFQGGYSSGYYSYKWAEVLDADAFEYFKEHGIFSREIASKFATHVLSKGGTEHPMTLYKRFRGSEPKPEALLKRAGLLAE